MRERKKVLLTCMGVQIRLIVSVLHRGQYMCTTIAAIRVYVRTMKSKNQYAWGYHKLSCLLQQWLHYDDTLPRNLVFCLHRPSTNLTFCFFNCCTSLHFYVLKKLCCFTRLIFSCGLYNIICFLSSLDTCKDITYVYTYSSGQS